MKRFVLVFLCVAIIACFSLPTLAEEDTKDKKAEKAKQSQKEDASKDVPKDEAKKEETKKEDAEKKDDVKKDEKKDEKKGKAKKEDVKKDAVKKKEPKKVEPKTIKVKKEEIHLNVKLKGIFEARKSTEIKLEPKQWSVFKILRSVDHGQKVNRGDLLIAFDPEKIDLAIADGRRALATARLNLKKAQKEFATYKKTLPTNKKIMARAVKEMLENQQWEEDHGRKLVEANIEMSFKGAKFHVESAREEYRQLKKMYEADDLTEETEEIILNRTKLMLENAEHFFKYSQARYDFAKKYGLDRFEKTYEEGKLKAKLTTEQMVALFPLTVELKKITMEKKRVEFDRLEEKLQKIQADRELMTIKAPCDGVVYYGSCKNGKWSGATSGTLEKNKAIPAKKTFMTVVRTDSLQVHSSVSEKDLPLVREGLKATARATVLPEKQLKLLIDQVAVIPSGGSFDVVLKIVGKTPEQIVPGMTCKVTAIGFYKKDALVVPATAIETDPLDDAKQFVYRVNKKGKSKKVRIKTGKTVDKNVEILRGVKSGDKILATPPKDEKK